MPLILGLAELTVGAILLAAGVSGASLKEVVAGRALAAYKHQEQNAGNALAPSSSSSAAAGDSVTATPANLSAAPLAVRKMYKQASALVGRPYLSGGGHGSNWLNAAEYDCSGFVSAVLGYAGIINSPQTTQTLPGTQGIASGPGKWVTIYDRTDGPVADEHVIIDIAGHWFESGGNAAFNPSGGVSAIDQPSAQYLAEFNTILHPKGY